jgi:hypothetical protein
MVFGPSSARALLRHISLLCISSIWTNNGVERAYTATRIPLSDSNGFIISHSLSSHDAQIPNGTCVTRIICSRSFTRTSLILWHFSQHPMSFTISPHLSRVVSFGVNIILTEVVHQIFSVSDVEEPGGIAVVKPLVEVVMQELSVFFGVHSVWIAVSRANITVTPALIDESAIYQIDPLVLDF